MNWGNREREWVFDHCGKIDECGIAHIPASVFADKKWSYSFRHPGKKMLAIPTDLGCALIFEGLHFVLE